MITSSIRKRTSKTGKTSYQITLECGCDPVTGERLRQYATVHGTKKEAERIARQMVREAESGGSAVSTTTTVCGWIAQWLKNYKVDIEQTTRESYREKIDNYIVPAFGKTLLRDLRAEAIQRWVNELRDKGLSPKTIRNTYNILNPALKKAVTLRMIPYNPCDGVELPKLVKPDVAIYDTDLCKQVVELAKGTSMYLIVLLEVMTGLRRGELIALTWQDVDVKSGVIHINKNTVRANGGTITKSPKSKAGIRDITIGPEVIAALCRARAEYDRDRKRYGPGFHDDGYVIHQKDGKPFRPDSITQKWSRFEESHGLQHIKFHGLRHSHATALAQAGVNPKVVQERLGHADVSITLNTYTHATTTMNRDAASKLDDIFFVRPDSH